MRILIITPYYLPGFKAGGPVRSLANLIDRLGDEFEFRVIAGDRDLGDRRPYAGIDSNLWQPVGKALVAYVPMTRLGPWQFSRLIHHANGEVFYLNSFFHPRVFALPLALRSLRLVPRLPVAIAPRGAFSAGAMRIKAWKKHCYRSAARRLVLNDRFLWHATSALEAEDIRRNIGPRARIAFAPNFSVVGLDGPTIRSEPKRSGRLRLAFLSRISLKKNLLRAIKLLRNVLGNLSLDVYGPIEDPVYWQLCQSEIDCLPGNVRVHYKGIVAPSDVTATLAQYDVMLLPTLGENFGHAIVESLTAGCPVLISERTPWRNLQANGVGWDVPLESSTAFEQVLAELVAMDEATHRVMRENARAYAKLQLSEVNAVEQNRQLFQELFALASRRSTTDRRHAA